MSPLPPETTPPGDDSFTASDDRLLSFLRRKIAGEPLPAAVAAHFHDTDIYAADPGLLTTLFDPAAPGKRGESGGAGGSWFFFTRVRPKSSSDSRKSRQVAGGVGTWHSERAPRRVLDGEGNCCAGHSQYFCYKLKTGKNCSERTEWYMVEFSHDQDQEADHQRVHGGEPQLVLCKIYRAHTHTRSSSGSASRSSCSASARKRKVVDEASSAPVKAKRRLFDSPAPASAVSFQEQVSTKGWIAGEAATLQGNLGDTSDCAALMSKADGEAATSRGKISDTLDWIDSMSKADGEAATSLGKMSGIPDWFSLMSEGHGEVATSQGKISDASDCIALMSETGGEEATSQGGMPEWFPLMSKGDDVEAATSQGKISDASYCTALMSKTGGEAATPQLKIGDTSDFSRFWPEQEATFDQGYSKTGGALPTLENCSREIVRDVGDMFCGRDAWSSAFRTGDDTTAFLSGMPSTPVLPPGEASWWWSGTGSNGVWSF